MLELPSVEGVGEFMIGLTGAGGSAMSLYELWYGESPLTGQPASRLLAVVGIIPFARNLLKLGSGAKRVEVSRSRYPQGARHVEDAQAAGHPSVLTVDRAGTEANRAAVQAGHARTRGMDLDEYPPAMFREGGSGASVRPMTPAQNRGMGSCIGNQCRGVPNGSQVEIIVVD